MESFGLSREMPKPATLGSEELLGYGLRRNESLMIAAATSSCEAEPLSWRPQRPGESRGLFRPPPETLAYAIKYLGKPSECLVSTDWYAIATWNKWHITAYYTTLGSFPAGKPDNGCLEPQYVQPDSYQLEDKRWHTALGIRIGSSVTKLVQLYPHAKFRPGDTRYTNNYWLTTRPAPWLLGPKSNRYEGLLVAQARHGIVVGLYLDLQAQGD